MTSHKRPLSITLLLALLPWVAQAADLTRIWQAAQEHDPSSAITRSTREAAETHRDQAAALWRPNVQLQATTGRSNAESQTRGANFSAPGFDNTGNVAFNTSVDDGRSNAWALSLRQPLINRERRLRAQQLDLSSDSAPIRAQAATDELMLLTVRRYFDVVLSRQRTRLLKAQEQAVRHILAEAQDRFTLGDAPITDVHEAQASADSLQAQTLQAEDEQALAEQRLGDSTGLDAVGLTLAGPAEQTTPIEWPALSECLSRAEAKNPWIALLQAQRDGARLETLAQGASASISLDLVAQAGAQTLQGSGDYGPAGSAQRQQMIGLQLQVPLYSGGARSARENEALKLQEKADAELDQMRLQVRQQTEGAWRALKVADARIRALASALKASESRLEATRLGREVGDRTTLDLLRAENDAVAARLELAQARVDALINQLRLQASMGDLSDAQLAAVNARLQP